MLVNFNRVFLVLKCRVSILDLWNFSLSHFEAKEDTEKAKEGRIGRSLKTFQSL